MHRPRHGGARGGDQAQLPRSRLKSSGGTTVHRTPHGGATAFPMAVHTGHGGALALLLTLGLGLVGIALGVAVPPDRQWRCPPGHQTTPPSRPPGGHRPRGGGATQAALRARFRLLFFVFFTTFANMLTPPSNHHLVHVC
jgi:hypothetical protein